MDASYLGHPTILCICWCKVSWDKRAGEANELVRLGLDVLSRDLVATAGAERKCWSHGGTVELGT